LQDVGDHAQLPSPHLVDWDALQFPVPVFPVFPSPCFPTLTCTELAQLVRRGAKACTNQDLNPRIG
jgi:hypothetical protein